MSMWRNICLMPVMMISSVSAAEWGTNYETALAQAKEEGKAVLADFTGSDWCGYCIRLRAQVLEHPSFKEWADKNFVLLEVDMPQNPKFDEKLRDQNEQLCKKYGVDGFPTVLVLDAQGRALGGLFGYEGDPEIAMQVLAPGLRVHQLLLESEKLSGDSKLQPLIEAWKLMPDDLQKQNASIKAEIIALDTHDVSGLRAEEAALKRLSECIKAANAAPTDAAALDLVNAALADAPAVTRKQLLDHKFRLMVLMAETHEDVLAAAEVAYAAIDADLKLAPAVKENRKAQLRGVFANPQTTLNRYRMVKRKRPKR